MTTVHEILGIQPTPKTPSTLCSTGAPEFLERAIFQATERKDSLNNPNTQITVLKESLEGIARRISANIHVDHEISGTESLKSKAKDSVPHMDETLLNAFQKIQEAVRSVDDLKSLLGDETADKAAVNALNKAMATVTSRVETNTYQRIAAAMRKLGEDYQAYIKHYGSNVSGDTRHMLDDAITLAAVTAEIAETQCRAKATAQARS